MCEVCSKVALAGLNKATVLVRQMRKTTKVCILISDASKQTFGNCGSRPQPATGYSFPLRTLILCDAPEAAIDARAP
jgi:hypothetical protein